MSTLNAAMEVADPNSIPTRTPGKLGLYG